MPPSRGLFKCLFNHPAFGAGTRQPLAALPWPALYMHAGENHRIFGLMSHDTSEGGHDVARTYLSSSITAEVIT